MKVCICNKSTKKIQLSKEDASIFWGVLGTILVVIMFFNVALALGLCIILAAYCVVITLLRVVFTKHGLRCSLRWAIISVARVMQYF